MRKEKKKKRHSNEKRVAANMICGSKDTRRPRVLKLSSRREAGGSSHHQVSSDATDATGAARRPLTPERRNGLDTRIALSPEKILKATKNKIKREIFTQPTSLGFRFVEEEGIHGNVLLCGENESAASPATDDKHN